MALEAFVTDLASIPRFFWFALRPDGTYAHAAVLHDYLYWQHQVPREVADEVLRQEMADLKVDMDDLPNRRQCSTLGGARVGVKAASQPKAA